MKPKTAKRLSIALICFVILLSGFYISNTGGLTKIRSSVKSTFWMDNVWSIGIYSGDSPLSLMPSDRVHNPVLTRKDVSDVSADFVADPFMIRKGDVWYLFFEVFNSATHKGDIGLAVSDDGYNWRYMQIVLDEPFHLSFPYVFEWKNEYYIIPESTRAHELRLYKADDFPVHWRFTKTLLSGGRYADPTIFFFDGKWWLFAETTRATLCLYYAADLTGPWLEHPRNPVIENNAHLARPGGRVTVADGKLIRFAQDDSPYYGNQVRAFEIEQLTTEMYKEREIPLTPPLKASGSGWNEKGMHTVDPHRLENGRWIACVDGFTESFSLGVKHWFNRRLGRNK